MTKNTKTRASQVADTGTVARVAMLLRIISERSGSFTLTDVIKISGLPAPTVHRLLDLLAQQGLVAHEKSSRAYRIGTELYRICSLVHSNVPLSRLIQPVLADAVAEMDETCYFALYLPAQLAVMYDSRVDSSHPLNYRFECHKPMSLLWGASGRTILAYLSPELIDAAIAQETQFSPQGPLPDREALLAALADIRLKGYSHTHGERVAGAVGVLAPVFDHNDEIYGALGFTIPEQRFESDRLPLLIDSAVKHAGALSNALGASEGVSSISKAVQT